MSVSLNLRVHPPRAGKAPTVLLRRRGADHRVTWSRTARSGSAISSRMARHLFDENTIEPLMALAEAPSRRCCAADCARRTRGAQAEGPQLFRAASRPLAAALPYRTDEPAGTEFEEASMTHDLQRLAWRRKTWPGVSWNPGYGKRTRLRRRRWSAGPRLWRSGRPVWLMPRGRATGPRRGSTRP